MKSNKIEIVLCLLVFFSWLVFIAVLVLDHLGFDDWVGCVANLEAAVFFFGFGWIFGLTSN